MPIKINGKISQKKIVQDIVPGEKRSIRNIPVERSFEAPISKTRRVKKETIVEQMHEPIEETMEIPEVIDEQQIPRKNINLIPPKARKASGGGKKTLLSFIIIFICIAIIGVAVSLLYSKAVVAITLKTVLVNIDGTFTAKKDLQEKLPNDLYYEVISSSGDMSRTISATVGPLIETKAKGMITIYNLGTSSQTLIAGTRLSSPDGHIYRITSSIVVPAKKSVPGKIDTVILADKAGAEYNMKMSDEDFKIVGYKGTSKYDKFYGRLKSDISGGFSGNKMTIDPQVQKEAIKDIKDSLKLKLIPKLKSIVPAGYVFYDDASFFDYEVSDPVMKESNLAEISIKANGFGLIFKSDDLLRFIAGKEIQKFPSPTFDIKGMETLNFKVLNFKDFSIKKSTPVIFSLNGQITIIGKFPEEKLKSELRGISLKASNAIFANYPAINNAHTLLTPFWMRFFPKSEENIRIEYNNIQK